MGDTFRLHARGDESWPCESRTRLSAPNLHRRLPYPSTRGRRELSAR